MKIFHIEYDEHSIFGYEKTKDLGTILDSKRSFASQQDHLETVNRQIF
jgi:hypothetical protein